MKVGRFLILFLTLFIGMSSIAMECGICMEKIKNLSVFVCPNKKCSEANATCKDCSSEWVNKNKKCLHECPYGCGSRIITCNKLFCSHEVIKKEESKKVTYKQDIKNKQDIKKLLSVSGLAGISIATLAWIVHFSSKHSLRCALRDINNVAQNKTNALLNFEFEGDGSLFLGLQESFDIARMLHRLESEEKRIALQRAIESYDIALCKVYNRIVSTYYYQPIVNFEQEESKLRQELKASTEQINQLITNYMQELGNPIVNVLLGTGVLFGIGILQIIKS